MFNKIKILQISTIKKLFQKSFNCRLEVVESDTTLVRPAHCHKLHTLFTRLSLLGVSPFPLFYPVVSKEEILLN